MNTKYPCIPNTSISVLSVPAIRKGYLAALKFNANEAMIELADCIWAQAEAEYKLTSLDYPDSIKVILANTWKRLSDKEEILVLRAIVTRQAYYEALNA